MIHRPFRLSTEDGEVIRGDLRLPDGPPPRSAVLVIHGFKGFKDWGFFPHVCETLASAGHTVASFNFSRNGVGEDLEEFTELEAFARNTLSRELDEVLRVLGEVRSGELLARPPLRVGLLGHSRGGGDAVLAAREVAGLDALATWSGVATFDRWGDETKAEWRREGRLHVLNARTGQQMPLDVTLLEDFEENRERLDIEEAAGEVEVPWLVVHGEEDVSVPDREARTLAKLGKRTRLELVPGAGHTFQVGHPFKGSSPGLDQALEATVSHFRDHLLGGEA